MIGALLRMASDATHREMLEQLHRAGFDDLRAAHLALFKFPGLHGMRPTELAEHVGMSKQGLNALLNELDELGYVRRVGAAADGRQRVLDLTDRGLAFAATMKSILDDIEARIAEEAGVRRYAQARAVIASIPRLFPPPDPRS